MAGKAEVAFVSALTGGASAYEIDVTELSLVNNHVKRFIYFRHCYHLLGNHGQVRLTLLQ